MNRLLTAIVVLAFSMLGMSSMASAEDSKNGVYVTGKMGASVMHLSDQKYQYSGFADAGDNGVKNGSSHRTGVFGGGVAVGYDFNQAFDVPARVELDFMARDKAESQYNVQSRIRNGAEQTRDVKNQVKLHTLMVNGYYDFYNTSDFTPYVTAGIGLATVDLKANRTDRFGGEVTQSATNSRTSNNFAWSVGAGVNYAVNESVDLGIGYRYLDAGKAEVSSPLADGTATSKVKVKTSDIMVSATYRF